MGISENGPPPQFGSFLDNVEYFDGDLFGIMRSEALTMDPQQRLLLETSLQALPQGHTNLTGIFPVLFLCTHTRRLHNVDTCGAVAVSRHLG